MVQSNRKEVTAVDFRSKKTPSDTATVVLAVLSILMGVFFIYLQMDNKPISREEAVYYEGLYETYQNHSARYLEIHFQDGSCYEVYPYTQTAEFESTMEALETGTVLYIAINPNNHYVIEIKTETYEILNFEASQEAIDRYDNGYIVIGGIACFAGVFLIWYVVASTRYKNKENTKAKARRTGEDGRTGRLRMADPAAKGKILLEAEVDGYRIGYRRVKTVNELVINGVVYDEKKGVIEFAHKLSATLDGHTFEAGYDEADMSYIVYDHKRIKEKRRWI